MPKTDRESRALNAPIIPTFFYFVVPSLVGLVALCTANLVDGAFVGHFVGADALAAVSLLIPYFTLLFGTCLMLAVGGCVRAGRYLGEGNPAAASAVFSKVTIGAVLVGTIAALLSNTFADALFSALGAPTALFAAMRAYLSVISLALCVQLPTLVLYYFVRLDGRPMLATGALVAGALTNMALDACFVGVLGWGLPGAAWSTVIAQCLQLAGLLVHFRDPKRQLKFSWPQRDWLELWRAARNGASEFVNELSTGAVLLVLNGLMVARVGVDGIAAFSVTNYALFLSVMLYYGVADAIHLLVSQNLGAGNAARIRAFMLTAAGAVFTMSMVFVGALAARGDYWLALFLNDSSQDALQHAQTFLRWLLPVFLVNGFNILLTVYLTAVHRPAAAGLLALCRSLVLPLTFLGVLSQWFSQLPLVAAFWAAEWTSLALALALCLKRPSVQALRATHAMRTETVAS